MATLSAASTASEWHPFLPLLAFNDPADVWADNPSFLVAECLFLALLLWVTLYAVLKARSLTPRQS